MKTLENDKNLESIVDKFSSIKNILVIGDVGIDKYTSGEVSRISPEAPVPVLEVHREWEKLGLAANISHNLKDLGIRSTLCGVIGDDDKGKRFKDLLSEAGISIDEMVHDKNRPTTFKERITTSTQQICRIDYESKDHLGNSIEDEVLKMAKNAGKTAEAIIIEDYGKGLFSSKVLGGIINEFSESPTLLAVDPSRNTPPLSYKNAGLLKPNFLEAKLMVERLGYACKDLDLSQLANILIDKLNLKQLVITLGKDGMALFDRDQGTSTIEVIPTAAIEVFDVSGAGDTTVSLLVSALVSGATLKEAAWIANCGAGVVVAKKGTATVNKGELLKHLKIS